MLRKNLSVTNSQSFEFLVEVGGGQRGGVCVVCVCVLVVAGSLYVFFITSRRFSGR